MRLVISLTTVPPRFSALGPVLASLAAQSADRVLLWVPPSYERFPDRDIRLPDVPPGVTLCQSPRDHGPATKCIPALAELGPKDELLICDDDAIYGPGWAAGFLAERARHRDAAIAASSYPVTRIDPALRRDAGTIVQGFAGVLLRADMLASHTIAARDRAVDDIWLSAQLAARGTEIVTAPHLGKLVRPHGANLGALQDSTLGLARPCNTKRQQRNLPSVLRRSVEPAAITDELIVASMGRKCCQIAGAEP